MGGIVLPGLVATRAKTALPIGSSSFGPTTNLSYTAECLHPLNLHVPDGCAITSKREGPVFPVSDNNEDGLSDIGVPDTLKTSGFCQLPTVSIRSVDFCLDFF